MKKKIDVLTIFWTAWLAFMILIAIAAVIFVCWVFMTYGDKPITEIPSWAFWVMQGGGK